MVLLIKICNLEVLIPPKRNLDLELIMFTDLLPMINSHWFKDQFQSIKYSCQTQRIIIVSIQLPINAQF